MIADKKPKTITSLPLEIRDQILTHLLVVPFSIHFDQPNNFKTHWSYSSDDKEKVWEILRIVEIVPRSRQLFYQHNMFTVSATDLEAFLSYRPFLFPDGVAVVPRLYIRRLEVTIQPTIHFEARKAAGPGVLPLLLNCPALKQLEIFLWGGFKRVCEYDRTFRRIADTCIPLGEKFGEDNFKVNGNSLYGEFTWTMQNSREKKFEGSHMWRGAEDPYQG
ncbi:MAG: hypothetical protein Q9186_000713 [Xanthomendoza sp. 1 TL-2023]